MEQTFNSNGKRRVAKLEMSVADPDVLSEKASAQIAQAEKAGSTTSHQTSEIDEQLTTFDIDAFTKDYRIGASRSGKRDHVFGRAEAARGDWNLPEDRDPHDRFGNGPAVQRYVAFDSQQYMSSLACLITRGHRVPDLGLCIGESVTTTIDFLAGCYLFSLSRRVGEDKLTDTQTGSRHRYSSRFSIASQHQCSMLEQPKDVKSPCTRG